jgi:CheY-like chemotaxis protein
VTPKLLLADDSVTIQRVIELTFADEDVEVLAVGDGQQAIERVQSDRPDIVLADVGMPERDGYEVAAFIKGNPQLAHIPVLLLTGAFEPVDEVRARAVGCDGVLVKPFEPQMVISRVRDLLAGNRDTDSLASFGRSVPEPARVPVTRHDSPGSSEPAGGSLEDYFDRLDAALATKTAKPPVVERHHPFAPEPIRAAPEAPRIKLTPGPHSAAGSPASIPPAPGQMAPGASPSPVDSRAPADAQAEAPARSAVEHTFDERSLQDAFSALLSAEQRVADAPASSTVDPASGELIDEIARRVISRMGDESMRAAVLDVAERLVREEIARIKGQN